MKQPQLGNRIKELREKKALTQKDLAFECNISERTLQRIENGHVNPRAFTLKSISSLLEHDFTEPNDELNAIPAEKKVNLKILSAAAVILIIIFGFFYFFLFNKVKTSQANVEQTINEKNVQFMKLLNKGEIDEVVKFYRDDACFITLGCGKEFIRNFYKEFVADNRVISITTSNVSVADSIAVEKGTMKIRSNNGEIVLGEYIAEWKNSGTEWLIVSEVAGPSSKVK